MKQKKCIFIFVNIMKTIEMFYDILICDVEDRRLELKDLQVMSLLL